MNRNYRIVVGIAVSIECVVILYLITGIAKKIPGMLSDRKAVATLHKEQYILGTSSVFPHFYEPEPDIILNDHPEWLGYNVSYSINKDSLNERMEYALSKPKGVFRMITLGDSFTYGLFVNTFENYSELLENSLNDIPCPPYSGFEVINLGVSAYDVGFSGERFRLRGQKYHPDLVIWFFNPFTFEIDADRKIELENRYLQEYDEDDRWGTSSGEEVAFQPARLAWNESMKETSAEDRITQQIKYFDNFLNRYHGPLMIIANQWPLWPAYVRSKLITVASERSQTWLHTALPDLSSLGGLHQDKHPNVKGHQLIASNVYTYLTENNLVKCAQ